jgi:hypothetical protein
MPATALTGQGNRVKPCLTGRVQSAQDLPPGDLNG